MNVELDERFRERSMTLGLDGMPNKALKLVVKLCMSCSMESSWYCCIRLVNLPSSYRPVNLLNIMRKILEKVIYNKLLPAVTIQGGLLGRQYGVRNASSTTDAMKLIAGLVENTIREKVNTNKYCVAVTLSIRPTGTSWRRSKPGWWVMWPVMIMNYSLVILLITDTGGGEKRKRFLSPSAQTEIMPALKFGVTASPTNRYSNAWE